MSSRGGTDDSGLRYRNGVAVFALVLIALIWLAANLAAQRDRRQAIEGVMMANSQLARVFEEHTVRALTQAQQLAVLIRSEYQRDGAKFDLARWFQATRFDSQFIQNALIADGTGEVRASAIGKFAPVSIADREHFRMLAANNSDALVISQPLLTRVAKQWSMVVALRIGRPAGGFGGMVGVSIDPAYFSHFYKQIDLGKGGAVNLIGLDGIVRARSAGDAEDAGQNIRGGELFRQLEYQAHGSYVAVAKVDGVSRIQSYRKLAGYPLVVTVGSAEDTALAEYMEHRQLYFAGAALMTILVAGAALWLRRSETRRRYGAGALRKREMQLLDAQELAGMVSLEWIVDDDRVMWSRPVEFLLGPKPEGGYPLFREMVHPDDRALWLTERQCALDSGDAGRYTDYRLIRTDGGVRWISCSQRVEIDAASGARRQVAILLDITERKLAEQALAAHEQELISLAQDLERRVTERTGEIQAREFMLRMVTENIPVMIAYFDVGGRVKFANLRFARAVDHDSIESVIGKSMAELIPPERMALHAVHVERARGGAPVRYELALRGDDRRYVEVNATPDMKPDGTVTGVFVAMLDIADRKLAEIELRAAVSLLSATLEATADGILVVGADRKISRFNQRFVDMWRIPPGIIDSRDDDRALGFVVDQLADPEVFVSKVNELYAHPLAESSDILAFKDGRTFERYSCPQMVDGMAAGRVWSFRDVTGRLRAEASLRSADERYRAVVANMVEGVTVRDAAGRIIDCNASAERILGRTRTEVLGGLSVTGDWKVIDANGTPVPEDRRSAVLALRTAKPQTNMVLGYCKPDGAILWLSSTSQPLFESGGDKPSGVFTTFVDITARKLAEDARDALETQLRESQKMEAMGTLAGGIAHDFNNLLAVILGNAALVNAEMDAAHPAAAGVTEINRAAYRAKNLVEQILTFSRKQPPNFVDLALRRVIEDTLGLLRATLPAGVQLEARFDTEPLHVRADGTQIGQVLMNLCTNAWHAMTLHGSGSATSGAPSGHLAVGLSGLELDAAGSRRFGGIAPGKYACLRVSDEGTGMDVETQARIFEPFFTTKPSGQGTGLGLSVVHGIVKAHGGAIAVTSSPGAGTTMEIVLPLISAPLAGGETPARAPAVGDGHGRYVLYLDDEPAMVYLVKRMLEKRGYRVSGFEQPAAALAALRAGSPRFDIVVTDYNMPGLSGLDVAREVRKINPALPVVITSGYISEDLRVNAGLAGVRHVIYKPNTVEELCQSIAQVLHSRTV